MLGRVSRGKQLTYAGHPCGRDLLCNHMQPSDKPHSGKYVLGTVDTYKTEGEQVSRARQNHKFKTH